MAETDREFVEAFQKSLRAKERDVDGRVKAADLDRLTALAAECLDLREFRDLMLRDCGLDNPQREVLVKETARKCLEVAARAEMSLSGSPTYYEALRRVHLWIRKEFGLEGPPPVRVPIVTEASAAYAAGNLDVLVQDGHDG